MVLLAIIRDVLAKAALTKFSPLALKIFSNPQVQALMTQILNLQSDMRQNIEAQVKLVARTLELVTRDELTALRAVVKELEAEVERLKAEVREAKAGEKGPQQTEEPQAEEDQGADPADSSSKRRKPKK